MMVCFVRAVLSMLLRLQRPRLRVLGGLLKSAFLLLPASIAHGAPEDFTIVAREAHDPRVFTQGLALDGDWFYESSGHYGRSFVLRYPRVKGAGRTTRLDLPGDIFAEGLEVVGDRLYLLSWQAEKGWVLDKNTLRVVKEFRYQGEGWGLTHTGEYFVLSDGSERLRFYDQEFSPVGSVAVHHQGTAVQRLNELEYQGGLIWANQWYSNLIYGIDPHSGEVKRTADLGALQDRSASPSTESVLNGIAYDAREDAFWLTGKYWRHRYLLRFAGPPSAQ